MIHSLSTLYRAVGILPQPNDSTGIEAYRQTVIATIRGTLQHVTAAGTYPFDTLTGFPAFTAERRRWGKTVDELVSSMGFHQLELWAKSFAYWANTLPPETFLRLTAAPHKAPAKESLRAA